MYFTCKLTVIFYETNVPNHSYQFLVKVRGQNASIDSSGNRSQIIRLVCWIGVGADDVAHTSG